VRVRIEDAGVRSKVVQCLTQAGTTILAADVGGDRRQGPHGVLVCDAVDLTRGAARGDLGRCVAVVPGQDGDEARRALAAGATGIVFAEDLGAIAATVTAVAAGQLVVPSSLRAAITKPVLTTREKQVMALVVLGFSNREIADQLFLAESTVKSHLFSAFRRLGVRTRKEAAALILDDQQGLGTGILTITR
jgi:DNA-binding NarL/FixJ family response regulator